MDKVVTDLVLKGIIDDPVGVNPATVHAIATELQAFRQANRAVLPDFQEWTNLTPDAGANIVFVRGMRDGQALRGANWWRITRHLDPDGIWRIYVDGWKSTPVKEAVFKVMRPAPQWPEHPVACFHDIEIMSSELLKRVRIAEADGVSHDDIIAMIEAEQGELP